MPSNLTVPQLALELRIIAAPDGALSAGQSDTITRLKETCDAIIDDRSTGAPQAFQNRAFVQLAAYLHDSPPASPGSGFSNAWINSGAAAILSRWVERRAVVIGDVPASSPAVEVPAGVGLNSEQVQALIQASGHQSASQVQSLITAALAALATGGLTESEASALIETHRADANAHHTPPSVTSGGEITLPPTATQEQAQSSSGTSILSWTVTRLRQLVQAIVAPWARSGDSTLMPESKFRAPSATGRGGPRAVTNGIIDDDSYSGSTVLAWSRSHVKRLIERIVPSWARSASPPTGTGSGGPALTTPIPALADASPTAVYRDGNRIRVRSVAATDQVRLHFVKPYENRYYNPRNQIPAWPHGGASTPDFKTDSLWIAGLEIKQVADNQSRIQLVFDGDQPTGTPVLSLAGIAIELQVDPHDGNYWTSAVINSTFGGGDVDFQIKFGTADWQTLSDGPHYETLVGKEGLDEELTRIEERIPETGPSLRTVTLFESVAATAVASGNLATALTAAELAAIVDIEVETWHTNDGTSRRNMVPSIPPDGITAVRAITDDGNTGGRLTMTVSTFAWVRHLPGQFERVKSLKVRFISELPAGTGLSEEQVDNRARTVTANWAQQENGEAIPASKLTNAQGGVPSLHGSHTSTSNVGRLIDSGITLPSVGLIFCQVKVGNTLFGSYVEAADLRALEAQNVSDSLSQNEQNIVVLGHWIGQSANLVGVGRNFSGDLLYGGRGSTGESISFKIWSY